MSMLASVSGEVSDSKVAAIFPDEGTARRIAGNIRSLLNLRPAQVQVVTPADQYPGRKLEPEGRGIFRTILVAHYRLGLAGLVFGALLFAVLTMLQLPAVVQSPWFAAGMMIGYGGVAGLMLGGLVSLRPDHDPYLLKVRGALKDGRSAVVVHAYSSDQRDHAADALSSHGGATIRTL